VHADEKLTVFVELERVTRDDTDCKSNSTAGAGKFSKHAASSLCSRRRIKQSGNRACFRSSEIHVFHSTGDLERTIPFSEGEERWLKISFDARLLNDTLIMRQVS
jgi:hypothetical protein